MIPFINTTLKLLLVLALLIFPTIQASASSPPYLEDPKAMLLLEDFHYVYTAFNPGFYVKSDDYAVRFKKYPGGDLEQPEINGRGMCSFFTTFQLSPVLETYSLCLYLSPAEYSGRIYLNGSLLTQIGDIRENYNGAIKLPQNLFIPSSQLNFAPEKNLLVYEIYPTAGEKTPFSSFSLGEYSRVESAVFWRSFVGIHFSQITAGISVIVFIYLLFLFFSQGRKDNKLLWFAILCLNFIFAYSNLSLTHNSSNMIVMDKVSRISLPSTVLFFFLFVMDWSKVIHRKKILQLSLGAIAVLNTILIVLQKDRLSIDAVFNVFMNFYILPLLLFVIVLLVISMLKYKNKQALIILLGVAFIIISSLHDIKYSNLKQTPYAWLVPLGFFGNVLSLFMIIALEQAATFRQSLQRAEILKQRNSAFQQLLHDISAVSTSIDDSTRELNDAIKDSTMVIGTYSQNNKQIISQMFEQFQHVETVIARVQSRMDTAIERIPAAINKQSTMVEKIATTLSAIDSRLGSSLSTFDDSLTIAENLYLLAEKSNAINQKSRQTIEEIQSNSSFLSDILAILEDLTEQTSLLSINVSIEATRAGLQGRGFSVIAGEIRKLAEKSRTNLGSSLQKIKEIVKLIELSSVHSGEIATSLESIVKESGHSATTVKLITGLIKKQKERSGNILEQTEGLLNETHGIQHISNQEQQENEQIKQVLIELREAFQNITGTLERQAQQEGELNKYLDRIKLVMEGTREHIHKLTQHTKAET